MHAITASLLYFRRSSHRQRGRKPKRLRVRTLTLRSCSSWVSKTLSHLKRGVERESSWVCWQPSMVNGAGGAYVMPALRKPVWAAAMLVWWYEFTESQTRQCSTKKAQKLMR